ncbi:hypothetical protein PENSTE_c003G08579 [Penicillium steckii]|uniref:Uncharacterized protein n=1 Tax=Penicillium steckii TaxID=303698 RepID=A0A1V6TQF9_9EURO|nr:hypothetical protein PENSTE_c003G08579 [Penicillium steckii]
MGEGEGQCARVRQGYLC